MDKEAIAEIRQMQFKIDYYTAFIEHIFLLLTKDANRQMLARDINDDLEDITNEICVKLNELLIETGRKKKV